MSSFNELLLLLTTLLLIDDDASSPESIIFLIGSDPNVSVIKSLLSLVVKNEDSFVGNTGATVDGASSI